MLFYSIGLVSIFLINIDQGIEIGKIDNVGYLSNDWNEFYLYGNSCDECICYAFLSDNSSNYQGINCYTNNKTCYLFNNSLSRSLLRIVDYSIFLFKSLDAFQTETQVTTSQTSIPQYSILQWNQTAITIAERGSGLNKISDVYGLFIADGSDTLYIADSGNNRILKWLPGDSSGILVAGGRGAGSNTTQLNSPKKVCVGDDDDDENIYVADSGNHRVQYFDDESFIGQTLVDNSAFGASSIDSFGEMFGIGVDLANNFYVSEYDKSRVRKWTPGTTAGRLVAGNGTNGNSPLQLNIPTDFYVNPRTGILFIPNQDGHCVTKWLPGNIIGITVAGICGISGTNETLLTTPLDVTFDRFGNMYIADKVNDGRIVMFPPNSLIGIPIITTGLDYPISIALDTHLNLYVSDYYHQRLIKYTLLDVI